MRIEALCTASASARTALTRGAEAGSPRRLDAASSSTRSTAWKRSCTARSTSGLSRTIWGKAMSQARSGPRACAPETSSVPRSSRRGPLPATKASTASGSGVSGPTTRSSTLEEKWLKTVRRETPARAATSSTVMAA